MSGCAAPLTVTYPLDTARLVAWAKTSRLTREVQTRLMNRGEETGKTHLQELFVTGLVTGEGFTSGSLYRLGWDPPLRASTRGWAALPWDTKRLTRFV